MISLICPNSNCGRRFTAQHRPKAEVPCPSCGTALCLEEEKAPQLALVGQRAAEESRQTATSAAPIMGLRDIIEGAAITRSPLASVPQDLISFSCQHCRAQIKARSFLIGKQANCPKCGESTLVTADTASSQASPTTAPPRERQPGPRRSTEPAGTAVAGNGHAEAELRARRDAEDKRQRLAEEHARRQAENRRHAEEQARLAEAQRVAEEQAQRDAEAKEKQRAEEEDRRVAEEHARQAEAQRLADEQARRQAEEQHAVEERARAEAQARQHAEEEARRVAEEQSRQAEEQRLAEERKAQELEQERAEEEARRITEEQARLAEEQRLADEQAKLATAHEQQRAEEEARRVAEEQALQADERRRAEQSEAEELEQRRAEEEARRLAEQERLAEEQARQQAEVQRAADEQARQEAESRESQRAAEEARQLAEERAREQAEEQTRQQAELDARQAAEAQRATQERLEAIQIVAAQVQTVQQLRQEEDTRHSEAEAKKLAETAPANPLQPAQGLPPSTVPAGPVEQAGPAPLPSPTHAAEEKQLRDVLDKVASGEIPQNRLGMSPSRLFGMSLDGPVLGREVTADIFGTNPFRYLAVSAAADRSQCDSAFSRVRAVYRLRPEAAAASFIKVGYDNHLRLDEPLQYIERLVDPKQRILYELFWPHLDAEQVTLLRQDRHLVSRSSMVQLSRLAKSTTGEASILATHALAIKYHNLAIADELAYGTGHTSNTMGAWRRALELWNVVIQSEAFWEYLKRRVSEIDHPELLSEDIDALRSKVPGLILGFNRLFAGAYSKSGEAAGCFRQLQIIQKSGFAEEHRRAALIAAVQGAAASRLEPLIRWAQDPTNYRDGEYVGGGVEKAKWSRREFSALFDPILAQAVVLRNYLADELKIDERLIGETEFDRLCEVIFTGLNKRIDYDNDDRTRAVLYGLVVMQRLLLLPLSDSQRRKIEKQMRDDHESLYRGFGSASNATDFGWDAATCWFCGSEPADPDASIELPVYKIVDATGGNVRWETRRILIPRSSLAAQVHQGKVSKAELAKRQKSPQTEEMRRSLQAIETERDTQVREIETQRDQHVKQSQSKTQAELAAYNQKVRPVEEPERQHIARADAQLQAQLEAERTASQAACAAVRESHQPAIAEAEREYFRQVKRLKGWGQLQRFELPALGLATVPCAVIWGALWLLDMLPGFEAVVGAGAMLLLVALIAAFFAGQTLRNRALAKLRVARDEIKDQCAEEVAGLEASSAQRIAAFEAESQRATSQSRKKLADIAAPRAAIIDRGDVEVKTLQSTASAGIAQVQAAAAQKAKPIEEKLAQQTSCRSEAEKSSYPPYQRAKSLGYSDGKEPSQAEVNRIVEREIASFFSSLTEMDKLLLAKMRQAIGESKFNDFLGALISMPSYERRAKLDELRRALVGF